MSTILRILIVTCIAAAILVPLGLMFYKALWSPTDKAKRLARKINKQFQTLHISRNGNTVKIGTHPQYPQMAIKITDDETLLVRGDGVFDWDNSSVIYDEDALFDLIISFFPTK